MSTRSVSVVVCAVVVCAALVTYLSTRPAGDALADEPPPRR